MGLWLAIAVGGASGAMARFWLSSHVYHWLGTGFPWGTLAVNGLGSLLMGFLVELVTDRLMINNELRVALTIGFLGSFTTFSTFAVDALSWMEAGAWWKAASYIFLSVFGSLALAATGYFAARYWF